MDCHLRHFSGAKQITLKARVLLLAGVITWGTVWVSAQTAEQTINGADWFTREIGQGVTWNYYRFDNLYNSKQSITYIEADLNNPSVQLAIPYLQASRGSLTSLMNSVSGARTGINGTYFDTSAGGGGHSTYLKVGGTVIPGGTTPFATWGWDSALTINSAGAASVVGRPGAGWGAISQPNIIACGPLLLQNNAVATANITPSGSHCSARHPRSAAGLTANNHLILLAVDGRLPEAAGMTCTEVATTLNILGCNNAYNLDGGGSTAMWVAGEPNSGIVSYPSDNSVYNHAGQRSVSNGIAIVAPASTTTPQWDARATYAANQTDVMYSGTKKTVTVQYTNLGSATWTAANTKLVPSRSTGRISPFAAGSGWVNNQNPVAMSPATVASGATATFTFTLTAPNVTAQSLYEENFMLTQNGVGRIGPYDGEVRFKVTVLPAPANEVLPIMIESREGTDIAPGINYFMYSESGGWGDAGGSPNITADAGTGMPGTTNNLGQRYGSSLTSKAGIKTARFTPNITAEGTYEVFYGIGSVGSAQTGVKHRVVHKTGTVEFIIDQTDSTKRNKWVSLGTYTFAVGTGGRMEVTNDGLDVSGNVVAGAALFMPVNVPRASVEEYYLYE